MNDNDISATLNILLATIESKRYELGIDDSKIKVRMGRHLAFQIMNSLTDKYTYDRRLDESSIFGYPLEIEYNNPMCLEVHIVEKVPIVKAGGLDD